MLGSENELVYIKKKLSSRLSLEYFCIVQLCTRAKNPEAGCSSQDSHNKDKGDWEKDIPAAASSLSSNCRSLLIVRYLVFHTLKHSVIETPSQPETSCLWDVMGEGMSEGGAVGSLQRGLSFISTHTYQNI